MMHVVVKQMMVLGYRHNHHAATSLPPGKKIEVLGPATDDRFLCIRVDGEVFEVFEGDFVERCIESEPSVPAASK